MWFIVGFVAIFLISAYIYHTHLPSLIQIIDEEYFVLLMLILYTLIYYFVFIPLIK